MNSKSPAQFIDFSDIHLGADEHLEDLYQRLSAFVEDSLLRSNGLTHHGEQLSENEELSPTLENFIVLTWLRLIHPSLPRLVKQHYGTELQSRTLASIKPEISQALNSLLEEIRTSDDARILRAAVADDFRRPRLASRSDSWIRTRQPRQDKVCPLCKQAGRSNTNHSLSKCTFLPDNDRRFMVKARQIVSILNNDQDTDSDLDPDSPVSDTTLPSLDVVAYCVQTRQSPYMDVFHGHRVVCVTIDTDTTGNMIRHSTAKRLGCPIISSVQQADGSSQLNKSRAHNRYLLVAVDPPFCDIKKFIGSQLHSSSYHVKLSECFKVPSDLADSIRVLPTRCSHESDDEDDPDTSYPPPSLPLIPDAISASVHLPSDNPQCAIPPVLEFPTDPVMDDAVPQPSYPCAAPLEKAGTSADPPPPSLWR